MSSQAPNSMLEFLRSTMDPVQLKRSELLAKLENFYVATKMDDKFSLEFSIMISEIAAGNMPEGYAIAVPGKSGSGKSTMIRHRLKTHPGLQPYVDRYGNTKQACLWVKTPAGCSMKSLGEHALKAAGYPGGALKNETAIWDKLRDALMVKEYKIVFFDEFQHVLHAPTSKSREHPANQIKAIMQSDTWPVWLILSGVDDMMGVIEADPHQQTSRRTRVVEMKLLTENEITFVASVLNELCSTVGFSVSFKPTRKFIMRLMHGGLQRFGMVVQLIKLSIQSAIFDDKTFHHKVINHDHFAEGYRRLSNCDDSTNVFTSEDWFNIVREVDEKRKADNDPCGRTVLKAADTHELNQEMTQTMLQVPLFADEVLPGFVSRLAKANRMGPLGYFCKAYGMSFHGLNHGKPDAIEMLSSLVGLPSEQLSHHATVVTTYRSTTLFGQTFEQALLIRNTLRFCPKCFEADELYDDRIPGTRRYRRAPWLLKPYRICHVHHCELVELPGRKTSPSFDFCVELDVEQEEIQRLSSGLSDRPASPVDLFIGDRFYSNVSHGPLIDQLETAVVLNISRVLGVALVHGRDQTLELLTQDAVGDATDVGYEVLAGGVDQFHKALDRISEGAAAGTFLRYGRFYTHIRQSQHKESYQQICELFQAHVADRYPLTASVKKFTRTQEEKWTTVAHIAAVTGLSPPVVRRRLVDASIDTKAIPVSALALFDRMSGGTIQFREAATILRCKPMLVSQLVAAGVLRRLDFDQIGHRGRRNTRLISEVEVNELHETIQKVATTALEPEMQSIKEVSERMGINRIDLIVKIVRGELKRVALSGRPSLLDDVMVHPSELKNTRFFGTHVDNAEALGILEISQRSLWALQNNRLIGFDEVSSDNRAVVYRVTSRAELAEFRERYVTVNQLIKATGLSQRQVRSLLRGNAVPPAISTAEGGCAFYDRARIGPFIEEALGRVKEVAPV